MTVSKFDLLNQTAWRPRGERALFEDQEFPADWTSLGDGFRQTVPQPHLIRWLRPFEITPAAKFVSDGTSRFDVRQGVLGDCWLLAAVASLSMHEQLFNVVVPQDQEFTDSDYCGAVRFRFWRFGEWTDVIVDDRLPTYSNRLVFMHSTDSNEFWSALLEKAYAKLMGSYEALKGGSTSEAMEDFTGGITEFYDLSSCQLSQLSRLLLHSHGCHSLMGCAIEATGADGLENRLSNGLIMGHAYSITDVRITRTTDNSIEQLIRIRNPWGNESEWQGAWSDSSSLWRRLPVSELRRLQFADRDDGEFWMSLADFAQQFHKLEVCHVNLDESLLLRLLQLESIQRAQLCLCHLSS